MAADYDKMNKDELIDLLISQEEEIDQLKDLQKELELENRGRRGGKGGIDAASVLELEDLRIENAELRDQQANDAAEMAKLREQVSETEARYRRLELDKNDTETKSKAQMKRIEALEKEVLDARSKSLKSEQDNKDIAKQKSVAAKDTQRLFQENDQLKEEVLFTFLCVEWQN